LPAVVVNQFILRRTNALLSKHLPPKVIQVVCCRLTELQVCGVEFATTVAILR
jgi:SNF2 family DNA or RNA helicase